MRFWNDEDVIKPDLDLNEHLVRHPAATFFMRGPGGELLIVDRALPASPGRLVIAVVDGSFKMTRMPSRAPPEGEWQVWGVVTYVIRKCM